MQRRPRGSLEREVLTAVAAGQGPQTVAEVSAAVTGATAYTTVMTTLGRLYEKGALRRERQGRGFVYSLATTPQSVNAALAARQMHRLLAGEGRREDVLARFVAELDPGDEQLLLELLGTQDGAPESTPPPTAAR